MQSECLIGRRAERAVIDQLLANARAGTSGALVVRGATGIGKSALLAYADAASGGLLILRAEAIEQEMDLPFAALHQLLGSIVDRLDAIPAAQAGALRTALGLAAGPADRFLIDAGVLSLLAEAAGDTGLLCLVDGAQWLDAGSREALLFASRRLKAEGVAVVFAARDGEPWPFEAPGVPDLRLPSLTDSEARLLLERSESTVAPAVTQHLVRAAGGNPLALLELPTVLTDAQRSGAEPLPAAMPVGDRVRLAFMAQVDRLPPDTQTWLLLAAAEPSAELRVLSRAAEHLALTPTCLDAAERAALVSVSSAGIRFRHPLLGSAIYHHASYSRRRAVHVALAEALTGTMTDRWAWHRAAIAEEPDEMLAEELERSADRALLRAGYGAAAAAMERAAELSSEPADRARRLVASADAAWRAGHVDSAKRLLDDAATWDAPAEVRASAGHVRGTIEVHAGSPEKAVAMLKAAADEAITSSPSQAARLLVSAMEAMAIANDFTGVPALAATARGLNGMGSAEPEIAFLLGVDSFLASEVPEAVTRLTEFIADAERVSDGRELIWRGSAALFLGDLDTAARLYDRAAASSRRAGAIGTLTWALELKAAHQLSIERFPVAEADAVEGLELLAQLGRRPSVAMTSVRASLAAIRGDADAYDWAHRTAQLAEKYGAGLSLASLAWWEAEAALARGRAEEATELIDRMIHQGTHPLLILTAAPNRVEAAVRLGRAPDLTGLREFEAWAAHGLSVAHQGVALRCRALLAADKDAEHLFHQSLQLLANGQRPYQEARARLLLGEWLRRQGRRADARASLHAAADAFGRLGASLWRERAEAELRATGGSVPSGGGEPFHELTPQELQVVRLVSQGLSNRQVSEQLFLSPRTVEYHLYKVYPKLGITSRAELTRRFLEITGVPTG